ncbi:MAG TPA: hypothetical protein VGN19_11760 [Pedococcus sp.]|jgi:hypothetical protein|nr:hypothetical protein [Pedococcus sp.]
MRRALTTTTVLTAVWALAACSSGASPTTLENDALAVTTAAATHDAGATAAAVRRLRADVAAARRSGTINAPHAAAIESAAQRVLVDLRGPTPAPSTTPSPTVVTPSVGDTKAKDTKGNGNGDGGGGGGGD